MRILHTESSDNWGGQEIRILREAQGMRERGHEIVFAVVRGGKLVEQAKKAGFCVYELNFQKKSALRVIADLKAIIRQHEIDIVNTHSSLDAWLGGIAARLMRKKVVRTRHLSTPIRSGLNSWLLYKKLADFVVTTSTATMETIMRQAKINADRCQCIPTGVEPIEVMEDKVEAFRRRMGAGPEDILVGTCCIVRSWKGIKDLMEAAKLLHSHQNIKWVVVGGGYLDQYQNPTSHVIFTDHIDPPFAAIAAMDIFLLLSTAHEGISQSSLQAAFLKRPLITTPVGGLPEVCIDGVTGLHVPPFSPEKVAEAILHLTANPELRRQFGKAAHALTQEKFTFIQTLDGMEAVYKSISFKI